MRRFIKTLEVNIEKYQFRMGKVHLGLITLMVWQFVRILQKNTIIKLLVILQSRFNLTFSYSDFFGRRRFCPVQSTHGMKFKSQVDMDSGLKYQAVKSGRVDAIDIFTTDGQLHRQIVVLKDDKNHPSYQAGTVVQSTTLKKYPQVKRALAKLDGILNDNKIAN